MLGAAELWRRSFGDHFVAQDPELPVETVRSLEDSTSLAAQSAYDLLHNSTYMPVVIRTTVLRGPTEGDR